MSNGASLSYDPLGRLWQVTSSSTNNRFLYDGDQLALEYDVGGSVAKRYAFGDQIDQPVFEDSGGALACGTTTRFLNGDIRGSVIAQTDCAGNRTAVNAYDEYGIPAATNVGRFQYTGQAWLPELGMYYYKARIYSPTLGRFMQTDPIGVNGGINIYAYAGGDPVNASDPLGLTAAGCVGVRSDGTCENIVVQGERQRQPSADIRLVNANIRAPNIPSVGGGGGGGEPKQSPQRVSPSQSPCAKAASEPGIIQTTGASASFVALLGATGSGGSFVNLKTGTSGYYFNAGPAAGADVSVGGHVAAYTSMAAFLGVSVGASATEGVVTGNASGNFSGGGAGVSPALGEGFNVNVTGTTIFACKVKGK